MKISTPIKLFFWVAIICTAQTVQATTYQTIANGNWLSSGTWAGGNIPPTDISSHTILIDHNVTVTNNNIKLMSAAQFIANGVTFTMLGGNFIVENGSAAFSGCSVFIAHGWNLHLTTSAASLSMIGCQVYIGQNFQNSEGQRYLKDICLIVDENYQNDKGTDTLINVCAVIGDSTSGNFQNNSDSWMHIVDSEFHLPNGDFQNQSNAVLSGNITALWLQNGDLQNSGTWTAAVGDYCVSGQVTVASSFLPASMNCTTITNYFNPCSCSGGNNYIPMTLSVDIVDLDCNNNNSGSVDLTVLDGTAPYTFVWSNAATTEDLNNLPAGQYTVTVTDASGAIATVTANVQEPPSLNLLCTATQEISCNTGSDGSLSATVSGGIAPYSFNWSTGQTTSSINGLSAGTYSLTITDANGCTTSCSSTLSEPAALVLQCNEVENILCFGGTNGAASVNVSGGTPNFSYIWSNGQNNQTATNLSVGSYSVTITDINGCTESCSLVLNEPDALSVNCSGTAPSTNGGSDGTVSVSVAGGTINYTYLWSNGATTASQTNLSEATYTITVSDANGCTADCSITLNDPPVPDSCIIEPGDYRTQTQGGWGATCAGNNPGCYRDTNFAAAFPNGLTIGCNFTLTLTNSAAVEAYLPCGGPSNVLTTDYTNPSCLNNTLVSQLITATLSVTFDQYDPNFSASNNLLINLVLASGPLAGLTVGQVLTEANNAVGGCGSSYSLNDLNQALTSINESFVDGTSVSGSLICPPSTSQGPQNDNSTSRNGIAAWPNPANGMVHVEFDIQSRSDVFIDVYNLNGNNSIRTLSLGQMDKGRHIYTWDGTNFKGNFVIEGLYLIQVRHNDSIQTIKIIMQ